jgi:hypothetical protein
MKESSTPSLGVPLEPGVARSVGLSAESHFEAFPPLLILANAEDSSFQNSSSVSHAMELISEDPKELMREGT